MSRLGILGGSGVYQIEGVTVVQEHRIDTPYGAPSSPIIEAEVQHPKNPAGDECSRLFFLARHGRGHRIAPHRINYRANICALSMLGVKQLISISAVGSMRQSIAPGDVVVVDQYIDWTKSRINTFFDREVVAHVSLADPVCAHLKTAAQKAAQAAAQAEPRKLTVHEGGTYLCMEGPQFSTRAESHMYRSWGVGVIGMTAATEARLAREAQLPYATLAMSTDYDCWHEEEDDVSVESVLRVLKDNATLSQAIIKELPRFLPSAASSPVTTALKHAVISSGPYSADLRAELSWLLPELA